MSTQTHERSASIQPIALCFVIGLILPTVFSGGVVFTVGLIIAITAVVLLILKLSERTDRALLLPVLAMALGVSEVSIAVLFLFLFVLFA